MLELIYTRPILEDDKIIEKEFMAECRLIKSTKDGTQISLTLSSEDLFLEENLMLQGFTEEDKFKDYLLSFEHFREIV